jgi:hypothetical protein
MPPHVSMQSHVHVGAYAGDVGEYVGDVGTYAGDVGEYGDVSSSNALM